MKLVNITFLLLSINLVTSQPPTFDTFKADVLDLNVNNGADGATILTPTVDNEVHKELLDRTPEVTHELGLDLHTLYQNHLISLGIPENDEARNPYLSISDGRDIQTAFWDENAAMDMDPDSNFGMDINTFEEGLDNLREGDSGDRAVGRALRRMRNAMGTGFRRTNNLFRRQPRTSSGVQRRANAYFRTLERVA